MSAAVDQVARDRALDPRHSFIIRAPAGSGKTGLLIQRYLALLARVEHPEEVVAITFTIKAAAEMRNRVVEALERAADQAPVEAYERRTWELAREVLARDRQHAWDIVAQPARLRVQTIDALCLSLARQMAWLSRLGGEVHPVVDASGHYQQAAHEVFRLLDDDSGEWGGHIATVLEHLDNNVPRFEQMLVHMLARRDQWLRHVQPGRGGIASRRAHLEAGLSLMVSDVLAELRRSVPAALAEEILAVAQWGGRLPVESEPALPGEECDDLTLWQGIADSLLTRDGKPRARFSARESFPSGPDELKQRAKRLMAALAEDHALITRLQAVRGLPDPRYSEEQWVILDALSEVLRVAAAMLRVVFGDRAEVDFIELVGAAQTALGEADAPTDLALAIDYRIRHILLDEFQDTSHSQVELLKRLTAGWQDGDGRTLCLVGDPMQSIYRFREADVGLYLNVRERGLGDMRLEALTLQTNFRSRPALIEWFNRSFPGVLPEHEDLATGAITYHPSVAHRDDSQHAQVSVHPLIDEDRAREAELVIEIVRGALRDRPGASLAILVRARTHLTHILPRLRREGVRYRGLDIDPLDAMPVVQDLLSLTRAIAYRADRLAWLAILRAPWCGLTLADLSALTANDRHRSVPDLIGEQERLTALSDEGRTRVLRLRDALHTARTQRARKGLRRTVEGAWLTLGGPACIREDSLAHATSFFDLLQETERESAYVDIDRLGALTSQRFAASEVPDAELDIMTVHTAKGLEFDTLIVPSLDRWPPQEDKPVLQWSERIGSRGRPQLLMAPIHGAGSERDPIYEYLHAQEMRKLSNEASRLLYVAATRARERLHLIGRVETSSQGDIVRPRASSLLARLWPAVEEVFERKHAGRSGSTPLQLGLDIGAQPAFIRRLPGHWERPAPALAVTYGGPFSDAGEQRQEQIVEFEWAGAHAKHVGTLVHRMLRILSEEGVGAWTAVRIEARRPSWRSALLALGVPAGGLDEAATQVEAGLLSVIGDARAQWLLDPGHREARSEYALSALLDGDLVNVILDRTFVDRDGTRWIVDYKTGRHEGAELDRFLDREQTRYQGQLERYAELMRRLDDRPIRLGLYFPIHRGWREWAPSDSREGPRS